jgi:hypothetical protein
MDKKEKEEEVRWGEGEGEGEKKGLRERGGVANRRKGGEEEEGEVR